MNFKTTEVAERKYYRELSLFATPTVFIQSISIGQHNINIYTTYIVIISYSDS